MGKYITDDYLFIDRDYSWSPKGYLILDFNNQEDLALIAQYCQTHQASTKADDINTLLASISTSPGENPRKETLTDCVLEFEHDMLENDQVPPSELPRRNLT